MGGRSSTSATTQQTDNRRVIGEGGISAENSSVRQTVYNENLGSEVVDSALSFAGNTVTKAVDGSLVFAGDSLNRSLQSADRAMDSAFVFGGDSLNRSLQSVDRNTDTAFAFGGDTVAGALTFGTNALNRNADLADVSMQHSADAARASNTTAREALGIARDSFGDALAFGTRATTQAFDSLDATGGLIKDAYEDAKGRGAMTDKILIGALIAMGVVAVAALRKG